MHDNKVVNAALYHLVCLTCTGYLADINRSRLVREVFLRKIEDRDENFDFGKFVEYEPDCFWGNKAAAFYMKVRPTYGLSEMSIVDEFHRIDYMDMFINAYIKGRQEARRDWYVKNPDVYKRDAEQHQHGSFNDDDTI